MTAQRADRIALLLIAVAFLRIAIAEPLFSVTPDEPMHVGAGLQILTEHRYGIQMQNPPLARVILALPPWLAGLRLDPNRNFFDQINDVFHANGHYVRDLALARLGSVLTFLLAAFVTWRLARRELDPRTAMLATLLFTTQPIVLGYSAIANHDTPSVAGLAVAMLAFARWIEKPTPRRAAEVGAAYAFSIAMKFACILYVPVACAAYLAVRLLQKRAKLERVLASIGVAILACAIALWASYGFTVGKLVAPDYITQLFGSGPGAKHALALAKSVPIPAPHFFTGILELFATNRGGHPAYAFGQKSMTGWWWYFPVCVALKTTIGSMLLLLLGVIVAAVSSSGSSEILGDPRQPDALGPRGTRGTPRNSEELVAMAVVAAAILASSLTAHLDVGVRYVLPLYVPFSIAGGAAIAELWRLRSARAIVVALLGWHLVAGAVAHPDYFPYFNEIAGRDPSRYLIDSNLDWGQDVLRLRSALRHRHAESVALAVLGPDDWVKLKFPRVTDAMPATRGWVAVSDHVYRMGQLDGTWWWLPPKCERIGKSIRLYNITSP